MVLQLVETSVFHQVVTLDVGMVVLMEAIQYHLILM
jgi:hypothetical protein